MYWIMYEVGNVVSILDVASGGGKSWIMYIDGGRNACVCQHAVQERDKGGTSLDRYLRMLGPKRPGTSGSSSTGTPVRTSLCAFVLCSAQRCSKARTTTLESVPPSEFFPFPYRLAVNL